MMRDYAERIEKKDALQAHPEYLNEQINDHDKAIYAKGWNDCNKEYYNAITELPVASIACTDLSMRLRRTFEADELVNQRILLDAADAIEELQDQIADFSKMICDLIAYAQKNADESREAEQRHYGRDSTVNVYTWMHNVKCVHERYVAMLDDIAAKLPAPPKEDA